MFSVTQAVATCGASTCMPVSSVTFVSFSDDTVEVKSLGCGINHTCGKTISPHDEIKDDDEYIFFISASIHVSLLVYP